MGNVPPSQKHVSTAIPPEGKFAEEPGEWQNGTILIEGSSTLFKWRTNYFGQPGKGEHRLQSCGSMALERFPWRPEEGKEVVFEKLSDEHSKKTSSSSRVRSRHFARSHSLPVYGSRHEGFWIAQSLREIDQAKADAKKVPPRLLPPGVRFKTKGS